MTRLVQGTRVNRGELLTDVLRPTRRSDGRREHDQLQEAVEKAHGAVDEAAPLRRSIRDEDGVGGALNEDGKLIVLPDDEIGIFGIKHPELQGHARDVLREANGTKKETG